MCDLCSKVLTKKEGIRIVEINKINNKDFDKYPDHYSAEGIIDYEICMICSLKIERCINTIKKLGEVNK